MTVEQQLPAKRSPHHYANLVNRAYQSFDRIVSPPVLDDPYKSVAFMDSVDRVLERLDPRRRQVLELHYGLFGGIKHSFKTICQDLPRGQGEGVGVTIERVRQIEASALIKLVRPNIYKDLKPFFISDP